jgi:hypothetical protein
MAEPAWESWLRERFPGYLLRNAAGEPRPVEAIATALSRLCESAGALTRLAEIAFLLDPEAETRRFVLETVPAYLRFVFPTTRREVDERHGAVRGHIDWSRTLNMRRRTCDPSWFVCSTPRRTFEMPELILVRWLLERVLVAIEDLGRGVLGPHDGWIGALSALHTEASKSLAHAALRDLSPRRIEPYERARCAHSPAPAIREALRVLSWHDALLPTPTLEALARSVARYALTPLSVDKRFELFVMLSVVECLDRLLPGAKRVDSLISPDRRTTALWTRGDERVLLYFDTSAGRGVHADVMKHYFGVATSVRPDIRLLRRADGRRGTTLYIDAKNSDKMSYFSASHLKMHGYIADRPGVFSGQGARAVIVCPAPVHGAPRDGDAVVFVGAGDCGPDAGLQRVLHAWLSSQAGRQHRL